MRTHYTGSPSLLFNSAVSAPRSRAVLALFGAFVSMLLAGGQVYAQSELAQVLAARVSTTPQRARVVIDLSGTTEFAIVSLDEPERIAIDVKASGVPTLAPQRVAGLGIVASFATSMAEEGRARTELTLNQPATVQQAVMLDPVGGQPARLVVDLVLTSDLDFKARVAADLAGSLSLRLPEGMSGAVSADDPFANTEQAPSSEEASMPPVSPRSAAAPSEPSTALVAQAHGDGWLTHDASLPMRFSTKLMARITTKAKITILMLSQLTG